MKKKAKVAARGVPLEVCRLSLKAVEDASLLTSKGNKYLLSDVEVALDLLVASYNAALTTVRVNQ